MAELVGGMYDMGGGGSGKRSEGADQTVTTLSGVTLSATGQASDSEFVGWACTTCPTSGDPLFPDGTSTAAVTAAIASASSASTSVDLPGPGRYVFTATWTDGTTETLTVYGVRPLPSASWDITAGEEVTAGAGFSYTLSDTGGADLPESGAYAMTIRRYTGGVALSLTHDGSGGFTGTFPSQDTTGRTFLATGTITDRYGRTSVIFDAMRMAGLGPAVVEPPAATKDSDGTIGAKTFGAFTDPESRIASYSDQVVMITGTGGSASGSGLGAYTYSGIGAGEQAMHLLHALDVSGDVLATAVHGIAVPAAVADPPLIAAPAKATAALDDGDQVVTFTDGASQGLSSTSASIVYGPSGHGASLSGSSPSLARTLTGIDTPGIYGIRLTGTNGDGSDSDTAIVEITSSAPTADAGAGQQHSGGTVNLDGSGSTASGARTIDSYAWTVASNSPDSATLTGASTATPSFTAVVGETYVFQLVVTDNQGETGTDSVTISPAATIVTDAEDYTTDVTAETLTYPGTDTLRDAAGTTDRANTRSSLIYNNGTTDATFEVTAADGWKLTTFNTSGSASGTDGNVQLTLPTDAAYGLTFVQFLATVDVSNANSNAVSIGVSSTGQARGADTGGGAGVSYRFQVLNDGGTVVVRGQSGNGGSISTAAKQGSGDSLSASADWWIGILLGPGGFTAFCYIEEGRTTFYDSVPDVGSGVYRQNLSTGSPGGQDTTTNLAELWGFVEAYDYSGNLGAFGRVAEVLVMSVNVGGE